MKPDQQRVKNLLADTVTLLCKNGLTYKEELRIEGLVGITIDNNEVFLVHINESFSGASTNVKSATPTVTPALDLPGYLKSAENHTESTNNAHSVQHKPNRIACPRQTVPTSTNSPLQLSKAQGRKSPKLSHNSNVQSPSSVTATTENYDTGQAVKLEDDDDDDVVIVSEVSNKRKHNNKTEEQEMDSSQNAIAQQAFPNVDFSALQDDQGFTDSLVDAGQSLSSKEPPMKRNRSQDDSQYMASIKHEQDTMTLDDSTSNQWENLTSMPGCSDWPGDDDSGLNQTQLGQTDAKPDTPELEDSKVIVGHSTYVNIVPLGMGVHVPGTEGCLEELQDVTHDPTSHSEHEEETSHDSSAHTRDPLLPSDLYEVPTHRDNQQSASVLSSKQRASKSLTHYASGRVKNYSREKKNCIISICKACRLCGPQAQVLLACDPRASETLTIRTYERLLQSKKHAVVEMAESCEECSQKVQIIRSWKPSMGLPLQEFIDKCQESGVVVLEDDT